jgi:hypothetical protein
MDRRRPRNIAARPLVLGLDDDDDTRVSCTSRALALSVSRQSKLLIAGTLTAALGIFIPTSSSPT